MYMLFSALAVLAVIAVWLFRSRACGIKHAFGDQRCSRRKGHDGLCRCQPENGTYSHWAYKTAVGAAVATICFLTLAGDAQAGPLRNRLKARRQPTAMLPGCTCGPYCQCSRGGACIGPANCPASPQEVRRGETKASAPVAAAPAASCASCPGGSCPAPGEAGIVWLAVMR